MLYKILCRHLVISSATDTVQQTETGINELYGVAIKTTVSLINYRCVNIKCHKIHKLNLLVVLVSEEILKMLNILLAHVNYRWPLKPHLTVCRSQALATYYC